jgi:hypothetical protein
MEETAFLELDIPDMISVLKPLILYCFQLVIVYYLCILSEFLFTVPVRDEVTGERRELRSRELRNLFSSPDIIRQIN